MDFLHRCFFIAIHGQNTAQIMEVPFTQVRIQDAFWSPRIETNRTVSIPSAFRECEKNGRFDNFAIAGGLKEGEHRGDFSFDDTDPYKIIEGASYSLAVKYDARLDVYLDSVIALIAAAQESDGYLTTCVTNRCTRLSGWWGTHRWEKSTATNFTIQDIFTKLPWPTIAPQANVPCWTWPSKTPIWYAGYSVPTKGRNMCLQGIPSWKWLWPSYTKSPEKKNTSARSGISWKKRDDAPTDMPPVHTARTTNPFSNKMK